MRIAISGSHRAGKSTLVEGLSANLPTYATVNEPYEVMAEDGYEFCHPPSLEDFQAQLEHAIASLETSEVNVLFDRCPMDFLGYLLTHDDSDGFELDQWLPRVRAAVQTLDLIVFVPIEGRDRIALSASDDDRQLRAAVDEKLRELLLEDSLGLDLNVVEVEGTPQTRAKAVMQLVRAAG